MGDNEKLDLILSKLDKVDERSDRLEERFDRLELSVRDIKLTLENEINKNIMRVAEGYLDLSRKLRRYVRLLNFLIALHFFSMREKYASVFGEVKDPAGEQTVDCFGDGESGGNHCCHIQRKHLRKDTL